MTFTGHLGELRDRLIRMGVVLIVAVIACFIFSDQLIEILSRPLNPSYKSPLLEMLGIDSWVSSTEIAEGEEGAVQEQVVPKAFLSAMSPFEYFFIKFKMAGYGGLMITFPWIIYQICAFVFPGLHKHERFAIQILSVGSVFLGILGVLVCYFIVSPFLLPYLMGMTPDFVQMQLRANESLGTISKLLMGFGIAFQFPMIVLIGVYLGVFTPASLRAYRKMAFVGMAIAAAILTPPDPISMLIMMGPLYLMYELSILIGVLVVRAKARRATAE